MVRGGEPKFKFVRPFLNAIDSEDPAIVIFHSLLSIDHGKPVGVGFKQVLYRVLPS
jgi:hypothetical protein